MMSVSVLDLLPSPAETLGQSVSVLTTPTGRFKSFSVAFSSPHACCAAAELPRGHHAMREKRERKKKNLPVNLPPSISKAAPEGPRARILTLIIQEACGWVCEMLVEGGGRGGALHPVVPPPSKIRC